MNLFPDLAIGITMALVPFLAVGGLLWCRGRLAQRERVRITRQIALTDAVHWRLGAAAAPVVRRSWFGGWTVFMAMPLEEEATVGAVVRIAHDFFATLDATRRPRLRIVVTPAERRFRRPSVASAAPTPAANHVSRAA